MHLEHSDTVSQIECFLVLLEIPLNLTPLIGGTIGWDPVAKSIFVFQYALFHRLWL